MKLIALNLSEPKPYTLGNRSGETGIFKTPVSHRVETTLNGLTGDTQVDTKNHGGPDKAVYGFSTAESAYWSEALGCDAIPAGKFGENLLIDGLDDSTVAIGDTFKIGTAILQVAQPRQPCFKMNIAFDLDTMVSQFIDRGHTGLYLRVLQTGEMGSGDSMELTERAANPLSVATLFTACFNPDRLDDAAAVLTQALAEPRLAENWRSICVKRLRARQHEMERKPIKLYHNAACGKSRLAIAHLQAKHPDLEVINYLETRLNAAELLTLIERSESPPEDFIRWDDARMLGIKPERKTDAKENAELLAKHPKILQRPLVDNGEKVIICRSDEILKQF